MPMVPFIGDAGAEFSAERVEVNFDADALVSEMRQIHRHRLESETAGQRHAAQSQAVVVPAGGAV